MATNRIATMVPLSEAKARLFELVREAETDGHVLLVRHGRPAAVLVSAGRFQELLDELDDLEDKVYLYERDPDEESVPLETLEGDLRRNR